MASNDDKVREALQATVKDVEGARDALQTILDRIHGGA